MKKIKPIESLEVTEDGRTLSKEEIKRSKNLFFNNTGNVVLQGDIKKGTTIKQSYTGAIFAGNDAESVIAQLKASLEVQEPESEENCSQPNSLK